MHRAGARAQDEMGMSLQILELPLVCEMHKCNLLLYSISDAGRFEPRCVCTLMYL